MAISARIREQIKNSSWIRKMFEQGLELRRLHGENNVFDLSLGNPLLEPPPELAAMLARLATEPPAGKHRYMPNAGFPEVRAAIAASLRQESGIEFSQDEILMSVGAAGALNVILRALLDPGDEVVLLSPYFAEYEFYVQNQAGVVREAACTSEFLPDPDALQAVLSEHTRAVIVNTPNNPSGVLYPESSIRALAQVVQAAERRFGTAIYLISDEPYRRLKYTQQAFPFVQHHHVRSLTATSYSKDLGLAGERIGYIAIHPRDPDRKDLAAALVFATRTLGFVNAPALMQRVVAGLQHASVDVSVYQRKRDRLYGGLRALGYECVKPEGAFFVFPRSPLPDDRDFVALLLEQLVLVVPGIGFGTAGYFRASYSVEDRVIEGALPAFEEAMKQATT
jgi:aspartate aminotransferase